MQHIRNGLRSRWHVSQSSCETNRVKISIKIFDYSIIRSTAFPVFTKRPKNVTEKSSSTVRLDCGVEGDPKPTVYWQFNFGNDFPAARERRMHVMPGDEAFFITNAKLSDQGVYTCTATNSAGVIKANATVVIRKFAISLVIQVFYGIFMLIENPLAIV